VFYGPDPKPRKRSVASHPKRTRTLSRLASMAIAYTVVSLPVGVESAPGPEAVTNPVGPVVSSRHIMVDRFDYPPGRWHIGEGRGAWRVAFDGYGWVGIRPRLPNKLTLRPATATRPDETHASLVVSRSRYSDFAMTTTAVTARQLRTASAPNPWETAWLVWHYTDNTHFYYLALKTNGWELGKADPDYPGAQRFLATGTDPRSHIGRPSHVRVSQSGATATVWIDGELVTSFTDREEPYLKGRVGFYTEDAEVRFPRVLIDSFAKPQEAK
jgi:hypothetical protein